MGFCVFCRRNNGPCLLISAKSLRDILKKVTETSGGQLVQQKVISTAGNGWAGNREAKVTEALRIK